MHTGGQGLLLVCVGRCELKLRGSGFCINVRICLYYVLNLLLAHISAWLHVWYVALLRSAGPGIGTQ